MADSPPILPPFSTRDYVEGVVMCSATAERCKCSQPANHVDTDEVHRCNPNECTGQWVGDFGGDTFRIVALPFPVRRQ